MSAALESAQKESACERCAAYLGTKIRQARAMQFYLQIAERSQSWHKDTVKNRYLQENGLFLSDTPLLSSTPQATAYRNKEHGKQYLDG